MTRHFAAIVRLAVAVTALQAVALPANAASGPQSSGWSQRARAIVLSRAELALGNYIYANRVASLRDAIETHRSELLAIADQKTFAETLTAILQKASGDKHIIVWFSEAPDENQTPEPTAAELARQSRFFRYAAYGYGASARLPGNVGYIKLGGFADMPAAAGAIDAAMRLVTNTTALIVDLRGNGGGDSDTVDYFLAYFFSKPTEVTGAIQEKHGKAELVRDFTLAKVGAPRYVSKPVYVLIDRATISGGEMFAYDMKALHRGLVIGQTSAGAANGLGSPPYFLNDHLRISVPDAITRNPYTGTNWEGVGVIPDAATDPDDALTAAYTRALAAVSGSYDPFGEIPEAQKDPAAALKAFLP